MKQEAVVKFVSEDKKVIVYCDSDTALGSLHDFLLKLKGAIIDRMVNAHKEEKPIKEEEVKEEPAKEEKKDQEQAN